MKILIVSMYYDYGEKGRGISGDYYYFIQPLKELGINVLYFDYMSIYKKLGREEMNKNLLKKIVTEKPNLVIFVPFTDQFLPSVIDEINNYTITIGYFFDDPWRIEYCSFWAKHFTYVTTSDINGIKKWRDRGYENFIYSPFGCNQNLFIKKNLPKIYDVTFIGSYHPYRAWLIKKLQQFGIDVKVWGYGWRNGRVTFEQMVDIFNQTRINLNLSNNDSFDFRYIFYFKRPLVETLRVLKKTYQNFLLNDQKIKEMIKARHFEINACGGFQLSFYVEGLEKFYEINKEIVIYESLEDMIEKIKYYLKHQDEREEIAYLGYKRTLSDHTMVKRLKDLLIQIGYNI